MATSYPKDFTLYKSNKDHDFKAVFIANMTFCRLADNRSPKKSNSLFSNQITLNNTDEYPLGSLCNIILSTG